MNNFRNFIDLSLFNHSMDNILQENNNSVLLETVVNDIRTKDFKDDFQDYIQLNYQSIYLHIKGLSQLYIMKGDMTTARRLQNLNTQLATALNQQQSFQFKKWLTHNKEILWVKQTKLANISTIYHSI